MSEDKLLPSLANYPNLGPPEVLPKGYKEIRALPGHQTPAPRIRWGKQFERMPIEQQLKRAKKVADAMNHAADIAQQRVQELIDIANHQERQLESNKVDFANQQRLVQKLVFDHNAEKQARIAELQELKAERARLLDALHLLASEENVTFVAEVLAGRWSATMDERKEIGASKRRVRDHGGPDEG